MSMSRNELIRSALAITGCALTGYAIGTVFNYAIVALSITGFLYFLLLIIAMVLAFIAGMLLDPVLRAFFNDTRIDAAAAKCSAVKGWFTKKLAA